MNLNSYSGSPGRPSWSPDGTRVAVNLNRQALIVERETGSVLTRIGPEGANLGVPQFSPDGTQLAYDLYTETPSGKKQWAIQVSDPSGLNPNFVVEHGRRPRWSPDGEKLAYASYTDDYQTKVSVVNLDGSADREVSAKPYANDFSWSPDGSKIAYEAATEEGYQLRTTDLTSGEEKILSNGDSGAYWDRSPEWSPSGETIAFERRHRQFPAASLYTVGTETGQEKVLHQALADVVDPVYSPDGKSLVFGSNHGRRPGLDLFRMDLDDLSLTQLTDLPGDEHSPAFSPDGQTIAYLNTDRRRDSQDRHRLHFSPY